MKPQPIIFEIPEATPTLNVWQRMHFRAKRRLMERYRMLILETLGRHRPRQPIERCVVRIERYSPKLPDWDNLYGGLKPVGDVLVVQSERNPLGLGLILDDSPKVIIELIAKPMPCKQREQKTVVSIFPLNGEQA